MNSGHAERSRGTSLYPDGDQMYIVKTDYKGDTIWTTTQGGSSQDYGFCVLQAEANGYASLGHTWSQGNESMGYLVRTNDQGHVTWWTAFGDTGEEYCRWMDQNEDRSFTIVGSTSSCNGLQFFLYFLVIHYSFLLLCLKKMEELHQNSIRLINQTKFEKKRSLFDSINWNARLVEINGSRGSGKTTLMLQKARQIIEADKSRVLYASLDDPFFFKNNLIELAEEFLKTGGKYLFLDEVHRYPAKFPNYDWSSELKTIYDRYPQLQVFYSGSSLLKLHKAKGDLSRRKITYNLPGLSFREYLFFTDAFNFEILKLEDILNKHSEISIEISSRLKIIPLFREYIKTGYFPFYLEQPDHYLERLKDVITVVLENDIPSVTDIPFDTSIKIKKLLGVISSSVPYTPKLTNLLDELHIKDQRTLLRYINYLEKAELIYSISKQAKGNQILRKPDKIYMNNTNLPYCFYTSPDAGTQRETFFCNQLRYAHELSFPPKGDFLIDGTNIFEIGGRNKSKSQLKDIKNSYFALDDIEIGYGNTIPLWLFGFLY